MVKKLDDIKALPVEHQPEQAKKVIEEVFESRIIYSSLMRNQVTKLEAAVARLNERVDKITEAVAATMIGITELVRSSCVTKVK